MKITIKGVEELQRSFGNSKNLIRDVLQEGIRQSTEIIKQRARRKAGSPPIVNTGNLARSINTKISGLRGEVGADSSAQKYAGVVEYGRSPGKMPPVEPIERWARSKLGQSGLGFVIARKIKQKGTKAQPYFEPAVKESIAEIQRIFESAIETVMKRL